MPPPCTVHGSAKEALPIGHYGEGFSNLFWQRKVEETLVTASMIVLPKSYAVKEVPYPTFYDIHDGPLSDVQVGFGRALSIDPSFQRPLCCSALALKLDRLVRAVMTSDESS